MSHAPTGDIAGAVGTTNSTTTTTTTTTNGISLQSSTTSTTTSSPTNNPSRSGKKSGKNKRASTGPPPSTSGGAAAGGANTAAPPKRRCVSNACIACRKRKSKCDGNLPSCAACCSVYGTECVYDPSSDHRRKGVYKKDIDNLKTRNSTLQTLIQAILDYPDDQVMGLVQAIRTSDNLEDVAEAVNEGVMYGLGPATGTTEGNLTLPARDDDGSQERIRLGSMWKDGTGKHHGSDMVLRHDGEFISPSEPTFESELSYRMSQLRVDAESGQFRFIGGTSNLIMLPAHPRGDSGSSRQQSPELNIERPLEDPFIIDPNRNPVLSWTSVLGTGREVCVAIDHLMQMYFAWHYPYFTTLSRELFFRDYYAGYIPSTSSMSPRHHNPPSPHSRHTYSPSPGSTAHFQLRERPKYCTPLLVNSMLALGCHFTAHPLGRANPKDAQTAGDHFFNECKRLLLENDEHVTPRLTTVQALGLMSVREAGCGREERGWSYSGMSFRMAIEMGLNLDVEGGRSYRGNEDGGGGSQRRTLSKSTMSEEELDARRVTFWGCFLFDKCWSNYMGRMPQLPMSMVSVPKYIIIPSEDAAEWHPYTDVGKSLLSSQPARTRAVALQILELCEISADLLMQFYNPNPPKPKNPTGTTGTRVGGIGKQEIRALGELYNRLEEWKRRLPQELQPQGGALPPILLMHMFHQLLYIHLFRPFLKYTSATLPALANLDPRGICVEAASKISKYLRFYRREYGLRQICNIAAYMIHSACTIHLINLPQRTAKRDIVQGLRSLEDMAEGWLCARRALVIMRILAKKWKIELPEEAVVILVRAAKGRAEQFGLLEVAEEEDDFDFRGSSVSAVSPMALSAVPTPQVPPSPIPSLGPQSLGMSLQQQNSGPQIPGVNEHRQSISGVPRDTSGSRINSPGARSQASNNNSTQHAQHQQQHPLQPQPQQPNRIPSGFLYTDSSAASSPSSYTPLSPFPQDNSQLSQHSRRHPLQAQYPSQNHYIDPSSPIPLSNVASPTVPTRSFPSPSPMILASSNRPSHDSQQYGYFNTDHGSGISTPSALYTAADGISIGYGPSPGDSQSEGINQSWIIRDHENFLWMASGSRAGTGGGMGSGGGRESLSGASTGADGSVESESWDARMEGDFGY